MHRIDTSDNTDTEPPPDAPGTPGYFRKSDPPLAIRGTTVSADWLNDVQENILAVLTAAGISPTKGRDEDLADAIYSVAWQTGDVKLTVNTTPDTGWVIMDDGTIGDAGSGGTTRANADCEDLFTLLWNNISDTWCPVPGGRGASAAADWAAGKVITLPLTLGRALGVSGAGSGLTSRALGENLGAETHNHTGTTGATSSFDTTDMTGAANAGPHKYHTHPFTASTESSMQPTSFLNVMMKL
ncbi:MAG: hypothetical protein ACYTAN_01845 [Planctomycetota bacterium]